jgi:hypothetical protein
MPPKNTTPDPKPTTACDPISTMEGEGGGVVTTGDATGKESDAQHSSAVPNEGELKLRNESTPAKDKTKDK